MLDLVVAGVTLLNMILIVTLRNNFTAGDVGLSVNVILIVTRALLITVQSWANCEASRGVSPRIMDSVKTGFPEPKPTSPTVLPKSWPVTGAVEARNVVADYYMSSRPEHLREPPTLSTIPR